MQISLRWLKDYVDLTVDGRELTVDELAERLTMLGLEIESIERPGEGISGVVVGEIEKIEPHPDADKLVVCRTTVGGPEPLQIVCGAKNMAEGDKVPTAVVGATLPGGFDIGRRKMRGVESQGMMCSSRELGIGEDHSGLMILPPEVEIGQNVVPLLGLDDVVFEIEVTPNRGDWASMMGAARELAALLDAELRRPDTPISESGPAASELSSVTIDDPDLCARYIGRVLTDVQIGPSPEWLAKRLIAAGQRPINNIVDVTNYVLLETGHPLHAFDYDKLGEHRIVVRRARKGERIVTIDEENRELSDDMLVIADANEPVALAGVMGGRDSEVGEGTVNVFLESAWFDPISIRRTARAMGMMTEASQRFQRGADPAMAEYAVNRAAQLMQELAGATVAPGLLDEYPRPMTPAEIRLRYDRTNRVLGVCVDQADQRGYIQRLGFELLDQDEEGAVFRAPAWRHDCRLEEDLIEEVARLHGYDRIEGTVPEVHVKEEIIAPEELRLAALREQLAGWGLTEVMNMTFDNPADVEMANLPDEYRRMVMLDNPLSENQAAMRTTLLTGLLRTASLNHRHGRQDLRVFEAGPVYGPAEGQTLPDQFTRLGAAVSGKGERKHWSEPEHPADLYDLKGVAEAVLEEFDLLDRAAFRAESMGLFQSGESGRIELDGETVGWLGRVSEKAAKAFDLEAPLYLMEMELDPLLASAKPLPQFAAIPAFPPSLRDLAVVVSADMPAGALVDTARQYGGKYLRDVRLFDVYTGKPIPQGKKSVALNLVFQSEERTLTDKATQKAWDNIVKALQKEHGAELR